MSKEGFYLCLSSGSSKLAHHPKNNAGDFTNELALPVELDESKNWEMGLCQISLPFIGKNQLASKLLEEATQSRDDAETTLKFAEELTRDAQQLKLAATEELKKVTAERGYVESERAKNEAIKAELESIKEKIEQDREFLHFLNVDLDGKRHQQAREAEENERQKTEITNGLTRLNEQTADHSDVRDAQRRALEEQLNDIRQREEHIRRNVEQSASQADALKKNLEQLQVEKQETQKKIDKAEQIKRELDLRYQTFSKLQDSFQKIIQDFQTARKSIPCVPPPTRRPAGDNNTLVYSPFSSTPIPFPVKNYDTVESLFNHIHNALPSVWRSLFALELKKEAHKIIDSFPERGLGSTYQPCTMYAHDRTVNRLNGYQYAICFRHRAYNSLEDLVQAITVIGSYTYDMARKVAWDIVEYTDRLTPHISLRITPKKLVHIPSNVYPGISHIHDKIVRQLTSRQEVLEYAQAVVNAVNEDEVSPSATVPDISRVGIRLGITVNNMEILLPPMIFQNIKTLLSFMRGAAPSQHNLSYALSEWRKLCHPLLYTPRQRRNIPEQNRYRSPIHILVQSDILELTRVGSGLTPLLRVMPYPLESERTHINLEQVQYYPVRPRWFNSIRILLTTSDGNLFSDSLFDGDCMVVVHIRPRDGPAHAILSTAGER